MAINQEPSVDVQSLTPFKKFIMTIGAIPTSYLESMTYAELCMWLCNYLQNTVIPTVNNNANAVEELQGLYIELKSYIDNYFDNLDVQTEINNKLDQMAQDGSLTQIVRNYIDPLISEQNQRIDTIENKVNSVASGSPKGVYATVSDLEEDDPDHDDIYLVLADGKWYYYDTSETAWTAGGTYQGTSVSTSDPTIEDIYDKLNPIYNDYFAKQDIQNVLYPATKGRMNNSGVPVGSADYGYTSAFFYARAGTYFATSDPVLTGLRIAQYSSPQNSDFISIAVNKKSYVIPTDNWYRVDVEFVDNVTVATSSILEYLEGYLYNDISLNVYDNTSLVKALSNPSIANVNIINDITVTQRLNIKGNKHIHGNGHTLTGNSTLTYLMYIDKDTTIIDDLKLVGSSNDVVFVGGTSKAYINNCDISQSNANDGVGLHGSATCIIKNSTIHDNYDEGVSTHDSSYCECYNVVAYNNGYEVGTSTPSGSSFGGIHFGGSKMGKAIGCYCYNNDANGIGFITIDNNYSSNAIAICKDNICKNNVDSGIRFGGAVNIVCGDNICVNNVRGILFYEKDTHGNSGYVADNHCFGNSSAQTTVWTGGDDGLTFETPLS